MVRVVVIFALPCVGERGKRETERDRERQRETERIREKRRESVCV